MNISYKSKHNKIHATGFLSVWHTTFNRQLLSFYFILFQIIFFEIYTTNPSCSYKEQIPNSCKPTIGPCLNTGTFQSLVSSDDTLNYPQVTYHPNLQVFGEEDYAHSSYSLTDMNIMANCRNRQNFVIDENRAQQSSTSSDLSSVTIPESACSYQKRVFEIARSGDIDTDSQPNKKRKRQKQEMFRSYQSEHETLSISIGIRPIDTYIHNVDNFHRSYRLALSRNNPPDLYISFVPLIRNEVVKFAPHIGTTTAEGRPMNKVFNGYEILADRKVNHSQCLLYTHREIIHNFQVLKSEEENNFSTSSKFTVLDLLYKGILITVIPVNLTLNVSTDQQRQEILNKVLKEHVSKRSSKVIIIFGVIGQNDNLENTQQVKSLLFKSFPGFISPHEIDNTSMRMINKTDGILTSLEGQSVKSEIIYRIAKNSGTYLDFEPWLCFSKKQHTKQYFAEIDFELRFDKIEVYPLC